MKHVSRFVVNFVIPRFIRPSEVGGDGCHHKSAEKGKKENDWESPGTNSIDGLMLTPAFLYANNSCFWDFKKLSVFYRDGK